MDTHLKGIAWDHPRGYDSVAGACAVWTREHPEVAIEWSRRSLQAFADASVAELAGAYDLLVIDHPHIPQAAAEGSLLALDGHGHDQRLDELARQAVGPSHATYAWGSHQYGLAIDAAAQVAVHRPDLLTAPPHTWDDVMAFAADGRMLWPAKPIDALSSFLTVAANMGTPCCAEPGVWIERSAGLAVLDRLHRLTDAVPAFCLAANPIDIAERLAASDEWVYAPLLFGYVNYARHGFRRHRLAYVDMPAGRQGPSGSCLGGAGIAVSARTRHPETAVAIAAWLASAEVQTGVYYASGGQPANRAAWRDAYLNRDSLGFFENTLATLDNAWVRPRLHAWLAMQERAAVLVHAALRREVSDEDCLRSLDDLHNAALERDAPA